jgi:hypothetical protein
MWIQLGVQLALWITLYAVNRWLNNPEKGQPKRNELNLPQVEDGSPIPLVYGRVRIDAPILVWHSALDQSVDDGSATASGLTIFKMDQFFVLGAPIAPAVDSLPKKLHAMWVGEKKFSPTNGQMLAGGFMRIKHSDPRDGGVWGTVQMHDGSATQVLNVPGTIPGGGGPLPPANATCIANALAYDYVISNGIHPPPIISALPASIFHEWPSYRHLITVSLTGLTNHYSFFLNPPKVSLGQSFMSTKWTVGTSPSLPPVAFEISAPGTTTFWGGGVFATDANPCEVIRDLLTNDFGRVGLSTSKIDDTSFLAATTTLVNEFNAPDGVLNGYSRVIYDRTQASAHIAEILRQLDASLYVEPTTGKLVLELIRPGYDTNAVPVFSDALRNIVEVRDYGLGAWRDLYNRVDIRYTNRIDGYKPATSIALDMANAVGQDGHVRTLALDFPGVTNERLAKAIGARELQVAAQPLAKITIVVDRSGIELRPGRPFRVTYHEYNLDAFFRVTKIDFGQLYDNRITIHGVQDAFATVGAGFGDDATPPLDRVPDPFPVRVFEEAPRLLSYWAHVIGTNTNPDAPRMMAWPRPERGAADYHMTDHRQSPIADLQHDVKQTQIPTTFTLVDPLLRENEPYDDGSGPNMLITNLSGPLAQAIEQNPNDFLLDESSIAVGIGNLIALRTATGELEFIAFESISNLGGTPPVFQCVRLWRGVMDTPAVAHAAGERGWIVAAHKQVGIRGWMLNDSLEGFLVPRGHEIGSGEDPADYHTIAGRCGKPLPPANFALGGTDVITATQGLPAVAGRFKTIARFEEGLDAFGTKRERLRPYLIRGDDPDDAMAEAVSYDVRARKVSGDNQGALEICDGAATSTTIDDVVALGTQGHGEIDVSLVASRNTGSGGTFPHPPFTDLLAHRHPTIRTTADRFRNLLINARFQKGTLAGWEQVSGTTLVAQSSTSLLRSATTDWYAKSNGFASVFRQTRVISGYRPRGMRALVRWFDYRENAGTTNTYSVVIAALDASNSVLSSTSTGSLTPTIGTWSMRTVSIAAIPAGTVKIRVTVNMDFLSAIGRVSTFALRVGNWQHSNLVNQRFEVGSFANWTNVVNSFVANTAIPLELTQCAQGGAFSSSEISQDYPLAATELDGTAMLGIWRATTISGDTGQVVLEARNGGGVLATTSTPVETTSTLNVWEYRRLWLNIPEGATILRVRLIANRAGGAGNSGACFDFAELDLHNYLDATHETVLDFSTPTVQQTPATWQQYRLAFHSITDARPSVLGGTDFNGLDLEWSDAVAHTLGKLVGLFGNGVTSISAYQFARAGGGSAPTIQAADGPQSEVFAFDSGSPFTVIVLFRIDEIPWTSVACGLVGRMDASYGWGLGINASGEVFAQLKGPGGTKTATRTGSLIADDALHMAAMTYDPVAQELRAFDERGATAPVSTASGLGEFGGYALARLFRVGRHANTVDTIPGMIARVWIVGDVMDSATVAGHWNYGKDPTGKLTTNVHDDTMFIEGPPDAAGATVRAVNYDQIQLGYHAALPVTGIGLTQWHETTNLCPSWDLGGASWTVDGGASRLATNVVDPNGRAKAATFQVTSTARIRLVGITLDGGLTDVTIVFYARGTAGHEVELELTNSSNVVKDNVQITMTASWKRYNVRFTGWDGSTATGRIAFKADPGNTPTTFDLAPYIHIDQDPRTLAAIPLPGASPVPGTVVASAAYPAHFNRQGELRAIGAALQQSPGAFDIVDANNNANNNDRRILTSTSSNEPRLVHYTGAGAAANSTGSAIQWDSLWDIRGRWAVGATLDNAATPFAGVVTDANVDSANYGRAATWTPSTVAMVNLWLGASLNGPMDGWLQRIVLRAREEKLP